MEHLQNGILYTEKNGWSEVVLIVLEKNHKECFEKLKIRHNLN